MVYNNCQTMKNKDLVVATINKGIEVEELGINIYTKHISAVLSWGGFTKDELKTINHNLIVMKNDSLEHKRFLETILQKIGDK